MRLPVRNMEEMVGCLDMESRGGTNEGPSAPDDGVDGVVFGEIMVGGAMKG